MKAELNKGDGLTVVADRGVKIVGDDGAEWYVRRSPTPGRPHRLEIMLVPGTGPNGEADIVVRPMVGNIVSVEVAGW